MIVIEGNGSRPSHRGDGIKETEIMYCLNQVDRHAVCYERSEIKHYESKEIFLTPLRYEHETQNAVIVEHHPNDSRTQISGDQKNCQGLTSRMGTGGGQCTPYYAA